MNAIPEHFRVSNFTKKNHFVPCFYSSLWAGEDGKLCEYSRPYERVKPRRKCPAEVDPGFGTGGLVGKMAVPLLNGADHDEEDETED
jgi:hypothetical protein